MHIHLCLYSYYVYVCAYYICVQIHMFGILFYIIICIYIYILYMYVDIIYYINHILCRYISFIIDVYDQSWQPGSPHPTLRRASKSVAPRGCGMVWSWRGVVSRAEGKPSTAVTATVEVHRKTIGKP